MDYSKLTQSMIFNGIDQKNIPQVLECLKGFTKEYLNGEYIIAQGDKSEYIGILISGTAHVIRTDIDGREIIITEIEPYDTFAESYVCAGVPFPIDVQTASHNAKAYYIPVSRIISPCSQACEWHKQLLQNMMMLLARKNIILNEKIEIISKKTIRDRVMCFLTLLDEKSQVKGNCSKIIIPFNREEMAKHLSIERCALSRELSRMKEDGLIDYNKNTFVILK